MSIEKEKQKLTLLFSSVHIVHMHSFNLDLILVTDIFIVPHIGFFLAVLFVTHACFLL